MSTEWRKQARANQESWDRRTSQHVQEWYRLDQFKQGHVTLDEIQLAEVGAVEGKSLLHLQCNVGLDTLSWARRGAIVTGVDISPNALHLAEGYAAEFQIPARFICSDMYDLPQHLQGTFDLVYTSQGVLCWLNDLGAWARVVAHFLKPGGAFYIMEEHPFAITLDEQTFRHRSDYPYFHDAEPDHQDGETYQWSWSLGDIVSALADVGLRIEFLHEYDFTFYQRVPYMSSADGRWWSIPDHQLPLMFTLKAVRPLPMSGSD